MSERHSEAAFETVIEAQLLANGYISVDSNSFDRERAVFPKSVLIFIRATQPKEWTRLEALHGEKTGEQILSDLCKGMDTNGALVTLRHGFKCYGRTLHAAFFKAAHELNPELEARYVRREPPGADPATALLVALRAIARCYPQPERHPRRHPGAEELAHRPDGGRGTPAVHAGPRSTRADLRVQASDTGAFRGRHRSGAHDHAAGRVGDSLPALQQGVRRRRRQPA
jgi:hypothetical protein